MEPFETPSTPIDPRRLWQLARAESSIQSVYIKDHLFTNILDRRNLQFEFCEIDTLKFDGSLLTENVSFLNCKFIRSLEFKNINNNFNLIIKNAGEQCICEEIILTDTAGSITIQNARINQIKIERREGIRHFSLKEVVVKNEILVNSCDIPSLVIEKSDINIFKHNTGSLGDVKIESNHSLSEFYSDVSSVNSLIIGNTKTKVITIKCDKLKSVSLNSSLFSESFLIDVNKNSQINNFTIASPTKGEFRSGNLRFNKPVSISNFYISGMELDTIDLEKVERIDTLLIHNSKINEELNLIGADIRKIEFDILDIRKASFKIHRTKFNENLNLINVEWPSDNKAYELDDVDFRLSKAEHIFQLRNLKESYRALKVFFLQKQNYFDAMIFSANELRVEQKVKFIETWFVSLGSFTNNFGDWFVLSTNKWFSNFGLSWARPLMWWFFVFHLLSIYVIVSFSDSLGISPFFDVFHWQWNDLNQEASLEGLKLYTITLLPVHNSVVELNVSGKVYEQNLWNILSGIPDFLVRIFASYFIFLIIRGSRKFNFKIG